MKIRARLRRCTNMAAEDARLSLSVVCFLLLIPGRPAQVDGKRFPSIDDVREWAKHLHTDLVLKLNLLTGYDVINFTYKEIQAKNSMDFNPVSETDLVVKMADTLSKMLSKKMDALWRLVDAAEEAARNHIYNPYLEKSDTIYPNAKELNDDELEYNGHFQQKVNFNFSSVHIPVEIFDGEISILNGLNWTAALDEHFRKNSELDPQILWQFFGSQTGFMRTYPASRWNKHGSVDLFDVRRQSWYTQGSSSPKDMIILIDKSGSTHGQALQLMKNAVKSILDTLGENDYVNIVAFAQEAEFVSKCFNHTAFVQANYRNKKQLERDVDSLVASGQAEYKVGLRFAFSKFEEFANSSKGNRANVGANCNRVIILLTDGGTDNAEEVFKEYNWPNKSVRVFTYAIGPTATPVAAIKWMACANRGYFSQIPAMGAIRAKVQEYLEVIGRPLALAYIEHSQWTSSHKSPLPPDNSGLGMMTTVTLPVYNRTLESQNQTILGVMGIDVPTSELGRRTPFIKIGPNGYSFAINPNGFAVFHPNLKRTGRYMEDPPNIDLLELELQPSQSDDLLQSDRPILKELRDHMIDGNSGNLVIENSLFLSPDKNYVSWSTAKYSFTNITNTTFRLGLCIPEFQTVYPYFKDNVTKPDFKAYSNMTERNAAYLIAPWDYLSDLPQGQNLNNTLDSLVQILKDLDANKLTGDQIQLLQHLAMDSTAAIDLDKFFTAVRHNTTGDDAVEKIRREYGVDITPVLDWLDEAYMQPELIVLFLATNGGLTMVYPPSEVDEFQDLLDMRNASYYQRALYSDQKGYVLIPFTNASNDSMSEVMAVRAVAVQAGAHEYRTAVVGVRVAAYKITEIMKEAVKNYTTQTGTKDILYTCEDTDNVLCYLVDDGGFLVASNQEEDEVGTFLGELDPQVWHQLQNESYYGRTVQYEFQAICKVQQEITSAGIRSFHVPSVNTLYEALTLNWWTTKAAWAFTSLNIYNWLFGPEGVLATQFVGPVNEPLEELGPEEEEDCVMAYQQFYFNKFKPNDSTQPMPDFHDLSVECPNCSRQVRVGKLGKYMNLIFIVTQPRCTECIANDSPVSQDPYRISEEQERTLICDLSMNPRRRVVSYGCYDNDPNEDDSKCGAGALSHSKLMAVIASLLTTAIVWLMSHQHR